MKITSLLLIVVVSVIGIVSATVLGSEVLKSQVAPFQTIERQGIRGGESEPSTRQFRVTDDVTFVDQDLLQGWMPWIIQQASILIGALSLIVFVYAGVLLILKGDNEEELGKAVKMLIFGVVGIALAAFSYSIIANVLAFF